MEQSICGDLWLSFNLIEDVNQIHNILRNLDNHMPHGQTTKVTSCTDLPDSASVGAQGKMFVSLTSSSLHSFDRQI